MEKKLYRSDRNKVLAGVCGGIGEYFSVDPVIIRLLAVVFCLMGGAGILAYIIAIFIIPARPSGSEFSYGEEAAAEPGNKQNTKAAAVTLGIILILLGGLVMLRYLIPWVPGDVIFAGCLVVAGIYFIARRV